MRSNLTETQIILLTRMEKMVSICILNWNCLDTLQETIKILGSSKIPLEIIIFDQGSTDGSQDFLKQCDNVQFIMSNENVGNCISRNEMINRAKYKYVLLLDSDIVPIVNSIEKMVEFMESNPNFSYIGYDFMKYSDNWDDITKHENSISLSDLKIIGSKEYNYKILLTQYGIFKKECLLECPFPTFPPFDTEGWGSEDDMVGQAIIENKDKFGISGIIQDRVYFHNKSSSVKQLGEDTFGRMYMKRYTVMKYYEKFLRPEQKISCLQNQKLPKTILPCNKYHWSCHNNLGDVATDYLLKEDFSFFEFDKDEKKKLLMFGGTIFNHIGNANKLNNANFTKILYFGVGLSRQEEIDHAFQIINQNKINFRIVPRGPRTKRELANNNIHCEEPCGDVSQLFSSRPIIKTDSNVNLEVVDIYSSKKTELEDTRKIRIADNKKAHLDVPFVDFDNFFTELKNCVKVYSSQIHPFFMSAMMGKSCKLYPKDWRARDFKYFTNFKLDMSEQNSINLRHEAQKNIKHFINSFYKELKLLYE